MVRWLDTLDPKKKSYFGSEVSIGGTRFAHGGSGIILSGAIMYEIAVNHNGTAAAWDLETKERCCGDLVLSLALQEHGMELQDVWPLMSGETHLTLPFGPATPEYWCRPAMSMHHLSPADMKELSDFEGRRSKTSVSVNRRAFSEVQLSSLFLETTYPRRALQRSLAELDTLAARELGQFSVRPRRIWKDRWGVIRNGNI